MKLQYREDLLCSKHFSVPCFQYTRMVAESPTPEECARRWGLIVIGARKVGAPEGLFRVFGGGSFDSPSSLKLSLSHLCQLGYSNTKNYKFLFTNADEALGAKSRS